MLANIISFARIAAAPSVLVFGYLYQSKPLIVVGIIIFIALTDVLDGWVARSTHSQSKLGEFIDPLGDKILAFCAVLTAILWFHLSWMYALLLMVRDLSVAIMVGFRFLLHKKTTSIPASMLGKATTFFQNTAIIAAFLQLTLLTPLAWITGVTGCIATIDYIMQVRKSDG